MKILPLLWANLTRRRTRLVFTLLSVIFAFMLFGVLMAIRQAFTLGANYTGADRLFTMSAVSLTVVLPISYADRIATVKGIQQVNPECWFGGYYRDPNQPIYALAVGAPNFFEVYPEYRVSDAQKQAWIADKRGVIVGRALARQYGWKPGAQIPLRSSIWRDAKGGNTWEANVDGFYTTPQSGADNQLLMHYSYLNDVRSFGKDSVSWFVLKIANAAAAGNVSQTVDALFANSPHETRTATEKAVVQDFAAQFGDIGTIVTAVVSAVLFTMLLVTANTMAQSVRERTAELALMKALGFDRWRLVVMVLVESLAITVCGGLVGLAFAYGVIAAIPAALLEFLPGLSIPASTVVLAGALMLLLGMVAALLPAGRALRLQVVAALRSI